MTNKVYKSWVGIRESPMVAENREGVGFGSFSKGFRGMPSGDSSKHLRLPQGPRAALAAFG